MRNNLDKVSGCVSFVLDDGIRPGIVLESTGTIVDMNNSFRTTFAAIEQKQNIKAFMDVPSSAVWEAFLKRALEAKQKISDKLLIRIPSSHSYPLTMHVTYHHDCKKMVAYCDVASKCGEAPIKTYFNAFRHSKDFLMLIDYNGIIRDVNEMHGAYFNRSRNDFVGKTIAIVEEIFPDVTQEMCESYFKKLMHEGYAEVLKKFERTPRDIRYYYITTYDDKETGMYVIKMTDRTEAENLEQQLAHSGSLSAVGQIAASIAHEIRNPMTTLKGFIQLLEVDASAESMKYLTVIEGEIERMESILNEMLTLSKPTFNKKTTLSLSVLVADIVSILNPKALMDGVKILWKSPVFDTLIYGNADKIKQVLLNLCKNGLESMEAGGILTIDMGRSDTNEVRLSITDTGKGMNSYQLKQIFMPFFTSKPGGTGLGLPFVLKVMEEHSGTIAADSQEGVGTTFMLSFPPAELCSHHISGSTSILAQ